MPDVGSFSEDGQWQWDGRRWQPVADGSSESSPPASTAALRFDRSHYDWYAQHGKWWTGYGSGQLEMAGGEGTAVPHGYEGWEYDDGYMWGRVDAAAGMTRDPMDPGAYPEETRLRLAEEAERNG